MSGQSRRFGGSTNTDLSVTLEGPFFTRDPGKTLYANIADMLDALAGHLEQAIRTDIEGHEGSMPYYTGWTRDHTVGYRTSPKTGKKWATWVAAGIPTTGMSKERAIRTKAAGASIEKRWHPFRRAKTSVYRARALITADLAKGLN